MLFDSHAHLEERHFKYDLDRVIERARDSGVSLILNVGYNLKHARLTVDMAQKYDIIYAAVGLHPHDAKDANKSLWDEICKLAAQPKVVAIGEMGLDYYRDHSPREIQRDVFRYQIGLAKDLKKPIIIHDRDANQDVLKIVKEEKAGEAGGVFHAFSASWEIAKEVLDMGFYLSIAGPVTFKNARKTLEVVKKAPLDRLLIETDCPFLTPHPFRGERNEPAFVKMVAEKIAELKNISFEEVCKATKENGQRLFGIS